MTTLNGVILPKDYSGIGLHDTVGNENCTWDYETSKRHARDELLPRGVRLFKLFGWTTKAQRARAYVDSGILTLIRHWTERPWGKNPGGWVRPPNEIKQMVDVGVQLIEFGNEPNLAVEWDGGNIPNAQGIAVKVREAWEVMLSRAGQVPGYVPLIPANSPGGDVDHRKVVQATIAEFAAHNLLGTVKHIAVHPRPLNQPPDLTWTPTRTCTFDEWRWIRDQWAAAGVHAYYWATEHGYSPFDNAPSGYPELTLENWLEWSWDLLEWLNPAHPHAIETQLAGVCHWFWAGMGTWGDWGRDALVDPQDVRVPKPTPLWNRMRERAGELAFERYTAAPPPPAERARGFDVSVYQGGDNRSDVDWDAAERLDDFAIIRVSVGDSIDHAAFAHYFHCRGLIAGGYHYLTGVEPHVQAQIASSIVDAMQLPFGVVDVEDSALTAAGVRAFIEEWEEDSDTPLLIYTRASFWDPKFGHSLDDLAARHELWVAHWNAETPTLPASWSTWRFWQTGKAVGPEHPDSEIDRDAFNGTAADLAAWLGGEPEPPPDDAPYKMETTWTATGSLYIVKGNYPVAGMALHLTWPGGYVQTVHAGDKVDWNTPECKGGFQFDVTGLGDYTFGVATYEWAPVSLPGKGVMTLTFSK